MKKALIILAAGFGSRLTPLTLLTPKALLKIDKQERNFLDKMLEYIPDDDSIDIYIVTGYKKSLFTPIISKYNMTEILNSKYSQTNSIISVYEATKKIDLNKYDAFYIAPSDCYLNENVFNKNTNFSWVNTVDSYSPNKEWNIVKRKDNKTIKSFKIGKNNENYSEFITGISYFKTSDFIILSRTIKQMLVENYKKNSNLYWEDALSKTLNSINLRTYNLSGRLLEIDTIDELIEFNPEVKSIKDNPHFNLIKKVFGINLTKIKNMKPVKAGMTNDSFTFEINDKVYIYRIPGLGSDKLINRENEFNTYKTTANLPNREILIHYEQNKDNGLETYGAKIALFHDNHRTVNPKNWSEVTKALQAIKIFHENKYNASYEFDVIERMTYYKSLILNKSVLTKTIELEHKLIKIYDKIKDRDKYLIHVDFICDNVLIDNDNDIRIIDWEYSGTGDKYFDLSAWCLYSYYSRKQCDKLLKIYLNGKIKKEDRRVFYSYIAIQGYLWYLWSIFKEEQNLFFSDYKETMLGYGKEYTEILENEFD
ncbi:phosphotransferase [Mycoplasma sp. ES3157-GEN-MYC]|uniref:Phosphotransferase n=1 Tax=Mycoplasma miroungigenitalium TaxID=754515 RepID=A0A6M4JC47_9MOLU|nr:phosphotransferase [Mycoplasma miroungigenitalium]MBU4690501.1 phosphotransferase [Mycoplasma miroungigenitalium]QJR43596.1 phosphotransferase [Mycoplasma miroungigenitalium]